MPLHEQGSHGSQWVLRMLSKICKGGRIWCLMAAMGRSSSSLQMLQEGLLEKLSFFHRHSSSVFPGGMLLGDACANVTGCSCLGSQESLFVHTGQIYEFWFRCTKAHRCSHISNVCCYASKLMLQVRKCQKARKIPSISCNAKVKPMQSEAQ